MDCEEEGKEVARALTNARVSQITIRRAKFSLVVTFEHKVVDFQCASDNGFPDLFL